MSEPVTHSEIEDVLSSIRRLVSETNGHGDSASPTRNEGRPATRLVLTPALRVPASDLSEDTPQESQSAPTSENGREGQPQQDHDAREKASVVAPFKPDATAAAEDSSARAESVRQIAKVNLSTRRDPVTEQSRNEATRILASVAKPLPQGDAELSPCEGSSGADRDEEIAEAPFVAVEDTEEIGAADPIQLRRSTSSLEAALPAGGPSVEAGDDAPWRDPEAKLFDSLADAETGTETGAETNTEAQVTDAVQDPAPKAQDTPREQSARVAAVVRRIAELETAGRNTDEAAADRNGTAVPDLNEDDIEAVPHSGPSVETIQWEDHQQDDVAADSFVSAREPAEDEIGAVARGATEEVAMEALSSAEDFLDEDALRALVSDIVREELQGPLGERITRNVRKLVRREIQRALASQELL
ncbi:hypothetical protein [Tritonibacter scottomollicae]|uniref:Uncharacterized protein n=1 Tax=Tritonibacter scottomollicae TaxID=483013 RepID=A0A2T1AK66_TRISK|nr:hypothetical protein [Tritonibacter scottomollicae]PRZ48927.1 hypothetical protein CLV89_103242 [Tritonibacter scottomollicae]